MDKVTREKCLQRIGPLLGPFAQDGIACMDGNGDVLFRCALTIGKYEYEEVRCGQVVDLLNRAWHEMGRRVGVEVAE